MPDMIICQKHDFDTELNFNELVNSDFLLFESTLYRKYELCSNVRSSWAFLLARQSALSSIEIQESTESEVLELAQIAQLK